MSSGSVLPLDVYLHITQSIGATVIPSVQIPIEITISPLVVSESVGISPALSLPLIYAIPVQEVTTVVQPSIQTPSIVVQPVLVSSSLAIEPDTPPVIVVQPLNSYAVSSSYSSNAGHSNSSTSSSYALSSSQSENATSSSFAQDAILASTAISSSYASNAGYADHSFSSDTASIALKALSVAGVYESASYSLSGSHAEIATSSSLAQSASYVDFNVIHQIPNGLVSSSIQITKQTDIAICNNQPANTVFRSIPYSGLELDTNDRVAFDLSNYTQYKVQTSVVSIGPSGSHISVQFSADQNIWDYMDNVSGSMVSLMSSGLQSTTWKDIDSFAKNNIFLRGVIEHGDGISDSTIRYIHLSVR